MMRIRLLLLMNNELFLFFYMNKIILFNDFFALREIWNNGYRVHGPTNKSRSSSLIKVIYSALWIYTCTPTECAVPTLEWCNISLVRYIIHTYNMSFPVCSSLSWTGKLINHGRLARMNSIGIMIRKVDCWQNMYEVEVQHLFAKSTLFWCRFWQLNRTRLFAHWWIDFSCNSHWLILWISIRLYY